MRPSASGVAWARCLSRFADLLWVLYVRWVGIVRSLVRSSLQIVTGQLRLPIGDTGFLHCLVTIIFKQARSQSSNYASESATPASLQSNERCSFRAASSKVVRQAVPLSKLWEPEKGNPKIRPSFFNAKFVNECRMLYLGIFSLDHSMRYIPKWRSLLVSEPTTIIVPTRRAF